MLTKFKARLLGIKTLEQTTEHVVIQIPRLLASDKTKRQLVDSIVKDAAILGKDVKVTVGNTLIRIDRIHRQ